VAKKKKTTTTALAAGAGDVVVVARCRGAARSTTGTLVRCRCRSFCRCFPSSRSIGAVDAVVANDGVGGVRRSRSFSR